MIVMNLQTVAFDFEEIFWVEKKPAHDN